MKEFLLLMPFLFVFPISCEQLNLEGRNTYAEIYCLYRLNGRDHIDAHARAKLVLAETITKDGNSRGSYFMRLIAEDIKVRCPNYLPTPEEIYLNQHK